MSKPEAVIPPGTNSVLPGTPNHEGPELTAPVSGDGVPGPVHLPPEPSPSIVTSGADASQQVYQQKYGAPVVAQTAQRHLDGAFVVAQATSTNPSQALTTVRGVTPTDWTTDRTVRASYLPAKTMLAIGKSCNEEDPALHYAPLTSFLEQLADTEINAVVVDIKEGDGRILFDASRGTRNAEGWDPSLAALLRTNQVAAPVDLKAVIDRIKARGLKVIVRQVLFKDAALVRRAPRMAIQEGDTGTAWGSSGKKMWVNPWSKAAHTYNLQITKRALEAGADEIQFDYIRFPDVGNGNPRTAKYPERPQGSHFCDAVVDFLKRAQTELKAEFPHAKLGADVFGYVAAGTKVRNELGQDVGAMAEYLDVLWPMQYPSHWAWSKNGVPQKAFGTEHPETKPYEVYEATTRRLIQQIGERASKVEIRPWVQAFYLLKKLPDGQVVMGSFGGVPMQEPRMNTLGGYVRQQINGVKASDGNGFALWGWGKHATEVLQELRRPPEVQTPQQAEPVAVS